MQTKNILKKRLIVVIFTVGISLFNAVKAQTDNLKDSVMALPADDDKYDRVFTKVENPATFPDGLNGWKSFLERNLRYPEKAQRHGTQGVVRVALMVDKNGNVKDVKALNDPGDGLGKESERVLKACPNWIPATQNGRRVNYRFAQTITFLLN